MSASQPIELGRHIVVWGQTGSGKTTFARQLAAKLGLTPVELDAIRHARGWDSVEYPEMRETLERRLAEATVGWVVDGSYSAIHDAYMPLADTLIWLNIPWHTTFRRLFLRTVVRAWNREPAYEPSGPHESWSQTFLSKRSILWWSISRRNLYPRVTRDRLATLPPRIQVHDLTSDREIEAFLANTKGAPASDAPPKV